MSSSLVGGSSVDSGLLAAARAAAMAGSASDPAKPSAAAPASSSRRRSHTALGVISDGRTSGACLLDIDRTPADYTAAAGQIGTNTRLSHAHRASGSHEPLTGAATFSPPASHAATARAKPTPATQAAQPRRSNSWPSNAVPTRPPKK